MCHVSAQAQRPSHKQMAGSTSRTGSSGSLSSSGSRISVVAVAVAIVAQVAVGVVTSRREGVAVSTR